MYGSSCFCNIKRPTRESSRSYNNTDTLFHPLNFLTCLDIFQVRPLDGRMVYKLPSISPKYVVICYANALSPDEMSKYCKPVNTTDSGGLIISDKAQNFISCFFINTCKV